MKRLFSLIACVLTVTACGVSTATEPEASAAPGQGYTPGLGDFMNTIQVRHAKLWFAGKGKNWPLAAYELHELEENFEDVAKYQPEYDGKPIAKLIEPMIGAQLTQLEEAIAAKDAARFVRAYDSLSRACSACHKATDHGFIVIQRPTAPPLTNQQYEVGREP